MDISRASSDKLLVKYAMKDDKKEEIFHSSGYARSQSGDNLGAAAGGETFSTRHSINDDRKYIKGYGDSKLTNEYISRERLKANASTAISQINGNSGTANRTEDISPLDAATRRANDAAKGTMGQPSAGLRGRIANAQGIGAPRPTLGNARAPQIPTRRSGI